MAVDPQRLRKTLAFLLRHRPDVGHLEADAEGWFPLGAVQRALGRVARVHLRETDLVDAVASDPRPGFEIDGERIRVLRAGGSPRPRRVSVPEILFLPSTRAQDEEAAAAEIFPLSGRRELRLHAREEDAWIAAHRHGGGVPTVLCVEAARAARAGVVLRPLAPDLYGIAELPHRFVLNLQPGFGVQASAGGFLLRTDGDALRVGLVRVRRRSGVTWEVAKGKVEQGETPAQAAVRELQEEMGLPMPLEVLEDLGVSHYAFSTPAGEPRLKVLHLFILRPVGPFRGGDPLRPEGIEQVAFFDVEEVVRVVSHGSLREPVRRMRRWVRAHGAALLAAAPEAARTSLDEQPVPELLLGEPGGMLDARAEE